MATWHDTFQQWLSESQSMENAQLIANYLYSDTSDWSKEAISALIGNMRHESSVNPNMYEYGYDWSADRGYGLVQWTPRSKYWDWATANGLDPEQGESQLARIDYEVDENIQWIAKDSVFNGLTFKEFRTNSRSLSVDDLTEAFTWGYERPNQQAGEESMPARQAFARRAYNELQWSGGGGGTPTPEPQPKGIDKEAVLAIVTKGKQEILVGIDSVLNNIEIPDNNFDEVFKGKLFLNSKKFYSNNYLKATMIMDNLIKVNPTSNVDFTNNFEEIIDQAQEEIKLVVNGGFEKIITEINNLEYVGGGDPEEPTPTNDIYFPVDYSQSGINFWKKSNWSMGQLQYEMCYGYTRNGGARFHAGYDIGSGGVTGLPVYATTSGVVEFARWSDSAGFMMQIKHDTDEYYSTYMHLVTDSNVVNAGDKVKAGQKIATMGNTPGGGMAVHLHYVLSTDGSTSGESGTLDPESYLGITDDNKTSLPNQKS